jgi:hypothetical protein
MSVRLREDGVVALEDHCGLDDAEPLLLLLSANQSASVDWRDCQRVHAAVLQILIASCAPLIGSPKASHLRDLVEPALRRYNEAGFPPPV